MNNASAINPSRKTARQVEDFLAELRYLESCFTDGLLTESELQHAKREVMEGRPVGLGFRYEAWSIPLD